MLKKSPDSLVIVSTILLLFMILTWFIPAGEFTREEVNGRMVVVAGSYHEVEASPQGFWAVFRAPLKGFESALWKLIDLFVRFGPAREDSGFATNPNYIVLFLRHSVF